MEELGREEERVMGSIDRMACGFRKQVVDGIYPAQEGGRVVVAGDDDADRLRRCGRSACA